MKLEDYISEFNHIYNRLDGLKERMLADITAMEEAMRAEVVEARVLDRRAAAAAEREARQKQRDDIVLARIQARDARVKDADPS